MFVTQISCTSVPSKIQRGSSECNWNNSDQHCSLRPPPNDAIFIILVALLTIILSIPILLFLHYLINGYGSNWPGGRSRPDDEGLDPDHFTRKQFDKNITENVSSAEVLRNSLYSIAFGKELKKGQPEGNTVDYRSINITAQIAYAGT